MKKINKILMSLIAIILSLFIVFKLGQITVIHNINIIDKQHIELKGEIYEYE